MDVKKINYFVNKLRKGYNPKIDTTCFNFLLKIEDWFLIISYFRSPMIIDGKQIAHEIQDEIGLEISKMEGRPPCLAVLLVGSHLPSLIYVDRKIKACEAVGMRSIVKKIASTISEADLINEVVQLNENEAVDGILLQLPLPPHINPMTIISHINPSKDVDGLHPTNLGKLLLGDKNTFAPCTPQGVSVLLQRVGVDVSGKGSDKFPYLLPKLIKSK